MKKAIPVIIILALSFLSVSALASIPEKPDVFQWVYDYADAVSDADEFAMAIYGQKLLDETGGKLNGDQVIAVIVDYLGGMEPADYATDIINEWGLGDNSILILLATGDRAIEVAAGRGLDRLFSAASRGEVIDHNINYLVNNQFSTGMLMIYRESCERVKELRLSEEKTITTSQKKPDSSIKLLLYLIWIAIGNALFGG